MANFHLVRRADYSIKRVVIYYFIGIVISLCIGAILLMSLNINPIEYYSRMLSMGLIGNKFAYKNVESLIKIFVPLLITSLALGLAFKMRFWNIGGEGEFLAGAICASVIAFNSKGMNPFLTVLLMCVAAMLSAGLIGLAVAALKVKFNTNETLMTLMLNYIMLYVIKYLGDTKADWNFFLREDSDRPLFGEFPENAEMGGITIGFFTLQYSLLLHQEDQAGIRDIRRGRQCCHRQICRHERQLDRPAHHVHIRISDRSCSRPRNIHGRHRIRFHYQ